jgi:hypothetical protein
MAVFWLILNRAMLRPNCYQEKFPATLFPRDSGACHHGESCIRTGLRQEQEHIGFRWLGDRLEDLLDNGTDLSP